MAMAVGMIDIRSRLAYTADIPQCRDLSVMRIVGAAQTVSTPSQLSQYGPHLPSTFSALRHRNFRLWFFGQMVSLMGTWMQSVAQGWLVYQLTGSELALGTITFIGSVPTLFLMLPAGALIDRVDKRKLLLAAQAAMMLLAFILAALAATRVLQVWHIGVLAFCLGIANSFDGPARHSMVVQMVDDRRDLMNAVALNSAIFNLARIVGPAAGGIILATMGAAWCFGLNGLSFLAVLVALLAMRFPDSQPTSVSESVGSQIKAGLGYVMGKRSVRAMMLLVGMSQLFGFWYTILLPAYASSVLHVGEAGLGSLNAATGVGALLGSLVVASVTRLDHRKLLLTTGSLLFPVAILLFAVSKWLSLSMLSMALAGVGFVAQNSTANTLIQLDLPDQLRGRVMALFLLLFFGATPFTSLMAGGVGQALGVRAAVAIGAGVTFLVAVGLLLTVPSLRRTDAEAKPGGMP